MEPLLFVRWFSAFIFIFFRCFVPKQQLLSRLLERAEKASQKEKEEKDALQLSWQWLLTNWWAGWSNHHRHKLSFKARNDELMDHDGRRNYDDRLALLDMVLWFCYVSSGIWSNIDYGNALRDICNASGNVVNPMMEVVGTWPTYCGLRQLQLSEELRELESQVWILGYFGTFWRVCGRWSFFLYIMVQYIYIYIYLDFVEGFEFITRSLYHCLWGQFVSQHVALCFVRGVLEMLPGGHFATRARGLTSRT